MPKCGVCGEQVKKLYLCRTCGVKFCEKCGSPEEKMCINCSLSRAQENRDAEHEAEREQMHEEASTLRDEEEREEEEEEDREENPDDYR
jgi:hypothetical protein